MRAGALILLVAWMLPAWGQHEGYHGAHGSEQPPLAAAYAADAVFGAEAMAAARELLRREHGELRTGALLADRLETVSADGAERYRWDAQGGYGGDIHKAWFKTEGEGAAGDDPGSVELQALYSRAVTPFFDFQAGVRRDFRPSPERTHLVIGMQGLLPGLLEIDGAAFVAEGGDVTGRFEAEHDLRVTQRLVLEPRIELNFAAQSLPELGIGSGVGSLEAGARLRYEIRRELAPYLGIVLERKVGETADLARAAGEERRNVGLVIGLRAWF